MPTGIYGGVPSCFISVLPSNSSRGKKQELMHTEFHPNISCRPRRVWRVLTGDIPE